MRPLNIVLSHHNAASARSLADRLRQQFRNVALAPSPVEIPSAIGRMRATVALVDLELVSLSELRQLCNTFPTTAFVAIHRLADEQMWSDALAAGAVDCCQSNDVHGMVRAADRSVVSERARAAVA